VRQEYLATAIACKSELLHNIGLLRLGYRGSVKVCTLTVSVALFLLETTLVVQPLISEQFAAIHTAYGNDHTTLVGVSLNGVSSSFGHSLDISLGEIGAEDLSGHTLNRGYANFEMSLFAYPGNKFGIVCTTWPLSCFDPMPAEMAPS
jgi:hypothetical protein